MESEKMSTAPMSVCESKVSQPESLTSLCEAENKGDEVFKMVLGLTEEFNKLLDKLSPKEEGERKLEDREAPNNRIEGLKLRFEDIETKLSELFEIKGRLSNIIG